MAVHRRQLPLAYRCEGFVPAPGSTGDGGFCEQCQEQVHDVSAMRESELRRLLAAHAGGAVCLSYRTDARGRVQLRPEPAWTQWQPLALGALASLLAACAGLADEMVVPGGYCREHDGQEVPCIESYTQETWTVPAEVTIDSYPSEAEGCPIRPTAPAPEVATATDPAPVVDDAAPGAQPTSAKFRANFKLDPEEDFVRGRVIVTGRWIHRDFVPTVTLWKQWRERRAERKRERERWRAVRGTTAAR